MDEAQKVVRHFKSAKLQLSFLREFQQARYHTHYALCLSTATRWGSQYSVPYSLVRSEDALTDYCMDPRVRKAAKDERKKDTLTIINILGRPGFWVDVRRLRSILEPIYIKQKISEGEDAHLGKVIARWDRILTRWDEITEADTELKGLVDELKPQFRTRLGQQTNELHLLAYALDPQTRRERLNTDIMQKVLNQMRNYIPADDYLKAIHAFEQYRRKEGRFSEGIFESWSEENIADPSVFWDLAEDIDPALTQLAKRLFYAIANSCASERSFSAVNLLQDDHRARLSPAKADMLTSILMNSKVFDRVERGANQRKSWHTLTEREELKLENETIQLLGHEPDEGVESLRQQDSQQGEQQEEASQDGGNTPEIFRYIGGGDRETQAYIDTQSQ